MQKKENGMVLQAVLKIETNMAIFYSCILQSNDVKCSQVQAKAHSTLSIINC